MKYIVETRTGTGVTRKTVDIDGELQVSYANNLDYFIETCLPATMLPDPYPIGYYSKKAHKIKKSRKHEGPTNEELHAIENGDF